MKNGTTQTGENPDKVVLGIFGDARLIGIEERVYLEGGSMADRVEAQEWARTHLRKPLSHPRRSCSRLPSNG